MMNYKALVAAALVGLCLMSATVQAEVDAIKIATVDVNEIVNSLDEAKTQKAAFESERAKAKKTLDERQTELKKLQDAIQTQKLSPTSKEGIEFRAKMKDYERFVRDTEEELKRDYLKANQKLGKMVFEAIEAYAKKNNIDLVLEKTKTRGGPLVFESGKADITSDIMATLK